MSRIFFAYHLTHTFGPFNLIYHTNFAKLQEGDLVYVVSGDKDPEQPGVDYFLEGLFRIRRIERGSWDLKHLPDKARTYDNLLSMEVVRRPDSPIPLSLADWYSRAEVHRFFSSSQNFNPLPTKPDYKSRFDELLATYASSEVDDLAADLAALEVEVPDQTERDVLAKARIGQGKFKAAVVGAWRRGERCALSGLAVPEMLIASHIKAWRESSNEERLDPMNGLLLAAHIDKLFDRHLMSFEETRLGFSSVLHPRIVFAVVSLGLKKGMLLNTSHLGFAEEVRFKRYMAGHLRRHQELVLKDMPPLELPNTYLT